MGNDEKYQMEAVKTYIEQTKVLISLSSAFVLAPAAAITILEKVNLNLFIFGEVAFVASVLLGYIVFSTIAGNQHRNNFNVHDCTTRIFSLIQIGSFIFGLVLFVLMIYHANAPTGVTEGGNL